MMRGNPVGLVGGLHLGLHSETLNHQMVQPQAEAAWVLGLLFGRRVSIPGAAELGLYKSNTEFYCVEAFEILDLFCKYFFSF